MPTAPKLSRPEITLAMCALPLAAGPDAAPRWSWGLALLSAGVTAQEVTLMQLLAYMQWHHFAYLVVALALLGFGASGTLLSVARARLLARTEVLLPWLAAGAGTGFAIAVTLLQTPLLRFDLYLLFVDADQWVRLTGACLLLTAPFLGAGLATSLMFTAGVVRAGRLYFANLTGAGAGAIAGLALLGWCEPMRATALTALGPLVAAMVLHRGRHANRSRIAFGVLAVGAVAIARFAPLPAMSPFKDLARTLDLPDARVITSEPSAQGWLQIVSAPALRSGPPADLAFSGALPRQHAVFLDGNRHGALLAEAGDADALAVFAVSPESLPWRLGSPRCVLLLQEGGEGVAAFAHAAGADDITLVEPHRALARVLRQRLAADIGVEVQAREPRTALARMAGACDLVRWPTVGAFGGSPGLRAVAEEFLLTREAFAAGWGALAPGGTLMVTAWMDHPERTPLRLLATLRAGLVAAGVREVRAHLVAVRGWASVTFLVRRMPLTAPDIAVVRTFCSEHGFDPLILPGLSTGERDAHHAWDNPGFFAAVDAMLAVDANVDLTGGEHFRLDPPHDGRPYFSQFLQPAAAVAMLRSGGWQRLPFLELGSVIVAATVAILGVLAFALIILPLPFGHRGGAAGHRAWTFGYFAALGAGFMLLEIVLMARLAPLAGGPVGAAAVVLATMLVAAGAGAHVSQSLRPVRATLAWIGIGSAVGVAALGWLTGLPAPGWNAPLAVRAAACVLMVAPASFVLGMAFPTGLRHLAALAPAQIPWAWAVNSCVSVMTPSLALLLAVTLGYTAVFLLAAAMYVIAALVALAARTPMSPGSG